MKKRGKLILIVVLVCIVVATFVTAYFKMSGGVLFSPPAKYNITCVYSGTQIEGPNKTQTDRYQKADLELYNSKTKKYSSKKSDSCVSIWVSDKSNKTMKVKEAYCVKKTLKTGERRDEIAYQLEKEYSLCEGGCVGGGCVKPKINECSSAGLKTCEGNATKTCEDYNSDRFLEWGNLTNCENGCENGGCLSSVSPLNLEVEDFTVRATSAGGGGTGIYRIGDSISIYIRMKNENQQVLNAQASIYFNQSLLEDSNLTCINNQYYKITICSTGLPFTSSFKNGIDNYTVITTVSNETGSSQESSTKLQINLYAPEPDPSLCLPLIEGYNDAGANRVNIIFIGNEYGTYFAEKSCEDAITKVCNNFYSGPEANGYYYLKISKNYLNFSCRKGDQAPIIFKNYSLSVAELKNYNSSCEIILTPFQEVIKETSLFLLDFDATNSGLFNYTPFKENKNKFNFWYIAKNQEIFRNVAYQDWEEGGYSQGSIWDFLHYNEKIADSCNVENKVIINLLNFPGFITNSASTFIAIKIPVYFYADGKISWRGLNYSYNNEDTPLIFTHEFSHFFAWLDDEYYSTLTFSGTKDGPNCYAGPLHTKEECLQNAPWKEMIGDGCGQDGIIDCTSQDKDYRLEIGCYEGCKEKYGKGIFRPTLSSVMSATNIGFGKWNEYLINQKLQNFSAN